MHEPHEWRKTYTVHKLISVFPFLHLPSSDSFHYRMERKGTLFEEDMGRPSIWNRTPQPSFCPFFPHGVTFSLVLFEDKDARFLTTWFQNVELPCWLKHRNNDGLPRSYRLYCSLVYFLVKIYDREKIEKYSENRREKGKWPPEMISNVINDTIKFCSIMFHQTAALQCKTKILYTKKYFLFYVI